MHYIIQYTPEDTKRYPSTNKTRNVKWHKHLVLILLIAAGFLLRIHGIPEFLIPGDPEVTKKAAQTMIADMKAGESIEEAVTVFCREILDSAA